MKISKETSAKHFVCIALLAGGMQPGLRVYGAEGLDPKYQAEVRHLLDYLGASKCQFYRNGEWHGPQKAKEHLNKKYRYLLKKSLIHSTEQFIALGATESSTSGEPYRVRCGAERAIPSGKWLTAELARYREQMKK